MKPTDLKSGDKVWFREGGVLYNTHDEVTITSVEVLSGSVVKVYFKGPYGHDGVILDRTHTLMFLSKEEHTRYLKDKAALQISELGFDEAERTREVLNKVSLANLLTEVYAKGMQEAGQSPINLGEGSKYILSQVKRFFP